MGGVPGYAVSNHSVGDHKQLTHAGGEGDFRRLATFCEPLVEDADRGITLTSGQGRHVQRHAYGTTASPDHSLTELRGAWVHPRVAINLAQWLSPVFAVRVSKWVFEWMTGKLAREAMPEHVRRYTINQHKIPLTHFSMLNQMTFRLLGPLEIQGYIVPASMMPDIALGRMFSQWLRTEGEKPESFPTYLHEFLPGDPRPAVNARLYPNRLITDFNERLDLWIRGGRAREYFGGRDEDAILPLDRVLAVLPASAINRELPDEAQS